MMPKKACYAACFATFATLAGYGQTTSGYTPNADTRYYDFWVGTWHLVVNGQADTTANCFRVARGVHQASYEEQWRQVSPTGEVLHSQALRAWDQTTNRWMFTWVSGNGLFQVWEGKKVNQDWYIYRQFVVNGEPYLSRQGWLPDGQNRLIRISEKSTDEGKTWQVRFKESYQRTSQPTD